MAREYAGGAYGYIGDDSDDDSKKMRRIKDHMKKHVEDGQYALLIEMAWVQLKREGIKSLHLK